MVTRVGARGPLSRQRSGLQAATEALARRLPARAALPGPGTPAGGTPGGTAALACAQTPPLSRFAPGSERRVLSAPVALHEPAAAGATEAAGAAAAAAAAAGGAREREGDLVHADAVEDLPDAVYDRLQASALDPPDERSAVAEGAASQASCILPDSCLALMLSPSPGRILVCDAAGHMLLTFVLDAQHKALSGNAGVLDAQHKALSGNAAPQGTSWCRASTPDACGTCAAESAVRLPLHTRKPRPRRVQGATRPHLLPHSPTCACTRSAHS